jgi:hypothetical protein
MMVGMKLSPAISARTLRISLAFAAAAWAALIVMSARATDDVFGTRVVACGFPIVYCVWLVMLWLLADASLKADRSLIPGPAKDLQLKLMRGPFVWFCNVAIIVLPATTLVVVLLGMFGLLPAGTAATP